MWLCFVDFLQVLCLANFVSLVVDRKILQVLSHCEHSCGDGGHVENDKKDDNENNKDSDIKEHYFIIKQK